MKRILAAIIVSLVMIVMMSGKSHAHEPACTERCMLRGNNCRVDCYIRHRGDSTEKVCVSYCSRLQEYCSEDCK